MYEQRRFWPQMSWRVRPGLGVVRLAWAAAFGFALICLLGVLLRPLLPIDETRYLSVAWEMHLGQDYLVPHRNGAAYADKPPLLFWLINLAWGLGGVREITARLVGPAAGLVALALTWRLARGLWPERPALAARAVILLASSLPMLVLGGLTMFDTLLQVATLAAGLCLMAALRAATGAGTGAGGWGGARAWAVQVRAWAGFGLALGFGVLAKGPVILLHVLPVVLAAGWIFGPAGLSAPARARGLGLALAVALAVVALWLGPALLRAGPEWRNAVLWQQSAGRIAQSFAHDRPVWFYLAALPLLVFPWGWLPGLWRRQPLDAGLRFCLVWGGAALLAFSLISGKQLHYLLPELPALALALARLQEGRAPAPGRAGRLLLALPALGMGLAALALASGRLHPRGLEALPDPRVLLALALLQLVLVIGIARAPGLLAPLLASFGLMLSVNLAIGGTGLGTSHDSAVIARAIAPHDAQGIAVYRQDYHAEFNFTGRLVQPLAEIEAPAELAAWMAAHPGGLVLAGNDRCRPEGLAARHDRLAGEDWVSWVVPEGPVAPGPACR